jgi:uncharacterized membrane protein YdfJ with MMPL/SSD domain
MGITKPVFDRFNQILINALATSGVESPDQQSILTLLNSLQPDIVSVSVVPTEAPPSDPNFHAPHYNANGVVIAVVIIVVILALVAGAVIAGFIFKIGGGVESLPSRQHDDYDLL